MPRGNDNKYPYEFLNKHELKSLEERAWEYRPSRGEDNFECDCGCLDFVTLRNNFGECSNCKAQYTFEDRQRARTYNRVK